MINHIFHAHEKKRESKLAVLFGDKGRIHTFWKTHYRAVVAIEFLQVGEFWQYRVLVSSAKQLLEAGDKRDYS